MLFAMYYDIYYTDFNFAHKFDRQPEDDPQYMEHFHNVYEMLLFVSGSAEFIIENQKFALSSGDFLFIPPGNHHCINIDPRVPYERYVIKFPEYAVPQSLLTAVKSKRGCYKTENTRIPLIFEHFDLHAKIYRGADACGLFTCVLKEVLYYFCGDIESQESKVNNKTVTKIIDYINENLTQRFTLDDICAHLHYSKSAVCYDFQKYMGMSVMRYVNTKKIHFANTLIQNGAKPAHIFEQCGFADYSTFFRVYKKVLNKSPSETRKVNKLNTIKEKN